MRLATPLLLTALPAVPLQAQSVATCAKRATGQARRCHLMRQSGRAFAPAVTLIQSLSGSCRHDDRTGGMAISVGNSGFRSGQVADLQ